MSRESGERNHRSRSYTLKVYLGVILALLAGSWGLARILHVQFDRVFLIVAGFLTMGGTWWRP